MEEKENIAMTKSNKSVGNKLEHRVCQEFKRRGWWSHNFAANASGQPMDIIAVKNGHAYLIDCKSCLAKGFAYSRIEENQRFAIEAFVRAGNNEGFFLLATPDDEWYMFSLCVLDVVKNMKIEQIKSLGIPFERWCELSESNNLK